MKPLKDMTGKKFGDWTVVKRGPNTKQGQAKWICQCGICKQLRIVRGTHLREGRSTKCKECHNRTFNLRHGQYESKTYGVWKAMVQRCHNPKYRNYIRYGGRGITVCEEWRSDFLNFWADMGDKPKELTIERVDNDKGYSKANCEWASVQEQQSNISRSHRPGRVYGSWKLIEKPAYSRKSVFECIRCKRKWISETNYVTSCRAASCKCKCT